MANSDNNIKFNYLYRDGGNYKQFGFEIFKNHNKFSIKEIEEQIREKLIDGEFFDHEKWGVKPLLKYSYNPELDHSWHEFEGVAETKETATTEIDILNFINYLR